MQIIVFILCYLAAESLSKPDSWGGGFSFGGKAHGEANNSFKVMTDGNKLYSDINGTAAGDVNGFLNGGVHHEANGQVIGVNAGVNVSAGGVVNGSLHTEVGLEDGKLKVEGNSSVSSDGESRVGGHANIATGDIQRRHMAEYGFKTNITGSDPGTEMDVLSYVTSFIGNAWLYIGLVIGCVVVFSCCLCVVFGLFCKLVRDVNSLKRNLKVKSKTENSNDGAVVYDMVNDSVKFV